MMRAAWTLAAACSLAACGANTLRLESAGSVATASTAVVDASREALGELRLRRARANAVIVASDPTCGGGSTILIRLRGGPGDSMCVAPGSPPGSFSAFDTRPVSEASIQPTLVLIAALADYAAVLEKTVGQPNRDIAAELTELAAKAGEAGALANALLGADLPDIPNALASKQAESAIKLAQFASDLAQEAGKVRRVRAIVAERDAQVGEVSAELQRQVDDWLGFAQTDADDTVNRLRIVYETQIRASREFEQRLDFVEWLQAARADGAQVAARGEAMKAAVTLLGESRATLSKHLAGNFSEAERRRIAAIERQRIFQAIRLLAQSATTVI